MKMEKLLWIAAALLLSACSPGDAAKAIPMAMEANILSAFKMVETFQAVRLTERDGFASSLAALKSEGYSSGRQFDELVAAQTQGASWKGYVFKDIIYDERGGSLNNAVRYGLSAVPEKSGAGSSFLLLIDLGKLQINEETGTSSGIGGELYKSAAAQVALERWPASVELASWDKIKRLSPKEGLAAAQDLKKKYDEERQ